MPKTILRGAVLTAVVMLLAGCTFGTPRPPMRHEEEWHGPAEIIARYADKDGNVTRAALEAGLHRDFEAADTNHDGVLEPDEVRSVNEKRWDEDKSAISPLQDWNGDGVVDFDEFAANARSIFEQYDQNGDGVVTARELHPQQAAPSAGQGDSGEEGRHRRGPRGGGDEE